ncbi:hypothetical cytosolic protein [Syntrophus aciditrophicus SB]|uniref:Hypothetical cytosolic protein n=1 Tax=Syntrophus aciditrophicus (strain SB) TaxID=56780 RepID=Q2LPT9_SYNAS|nr:hypothetical cytosolic protein [Syntrophus aciditrophicus SB]
MPVKLTGIHQKCFRRNDELNQGVVSATTGDDCLIGGKERRCQRPAFSHLFCT